MTTVSATLSVPRGGGAGDVYEVLSAEELLRRLDELHDGETREDAPAMALLELQSGDVLAVGLGREETVLSFTGASGDPPYLVSRGESESDASLVFFYDAHWTEFSRRNAIPWSLARDVLAEYFTSGALPRSIVWEEV